MITEKEIKDQCLRIIYIEDQLIALDNNQNPNNLPPIVKVALLNSRQVEVLKLGEIVLEFSKGSSSSEPAN